MTIVSCVLVLLPTAELRRTSAYKMIIKIELLCVFVGSILEWIYFLY